MTGGMAAALTQPPGSSIRDLVTSSFTFSVWITAFSTSALVLIFLKVMAGLRNRGYFTGEGDLFLQDAFRTSSSSSLVLDEPVYWILLSFCQRGSLEFSSSKVILERDNNSKGNYSQDYLELLRLIHLG